MSNHLLHLAWRSMLARRTTAILTIIAVALSVALFAGVEKTRKAASDGFYGAVSGVDLIVGGRTGPVNLLLFSVFRIGDATSPISYNAFENIQARPEVEWAVPISMGDSHRGYRVVGTSPEYFERIEFGASQSLEFAQGNVFNPHKLEAVLGSSVARELGYGLDQGLILAHGLGKGDIATHDDYQFRVVGILKPTGTPIDQGVYTSLEGIERMHGGGASHDDHAEHEAAENHHDGHEHHDHAAPAEHDHNHADHEAHEHEQSAVADDHSGHDHSDHDHATHDHADHEHDDGHDHEAHADHSSHDDEHAHEEEEAHDAHSEAHNHDDGHDNEQHDHAAHAEDHSEHDDHDHAHDQGQDADAHDDHVHLEPGQITAILVGTKAPALALRLRYLVNMDKDEPMLAIQPAQTLHALWQIVGAAARALTAVSLFVLAVGLATILIAILTSLNERRREMAILRAAGARPQHVFFLIVAEAVILAAIGAFIGLFAVHVGLYFLAPVIQDRFGLALTMMLPRWTDIAVLVGTPLAAGLMALWPASRAMKNALSDGLSIRI